MFCGVTFITESIVRCIFGIIFSARNTIGLLDRLTTLRLNRGQKENCCILVIKLFLSKTYLSLTEYLKQLVQREEFYWILNQYKSC